jgi:hypothetical protein
VEYKSDADESSSDSEKSVKGGEDSLLWDYFDTVPKCASGVLFMYIVVFGCCFRSYITCWFLVYLLTRITTATLFLLEKNCNLKLCTVSPNHQPDIQIT